MKRLLGLTILAALLLAACGSPTSEGSTATGSGGSAGSSCPAWDGTGSPPPPCDDADLDPSDPEQPISDDGASPQPDPGSGEPQRVEPRPGMVDIRRIGWEKAKKLGPRALDIVYWSGVEPCYVLDHVDVRYRKDSIVVTLFEGHDEQDEDTACIEVAVQKVVRVDLRQDIDGRQIVDGSRA